MKKLFTIKKNGKYIKDFTDGCELTADLSKAEQYTSKKSALVVAREYAKQNGNGYTVVEI